MRGTVWFSLDAGQLDVGVEGGVQVGQSLRVAALPQARHHGLLGQHGLLGFAAGSLDGSQLDELVDRFQFTQSVHLRDEEEREDRKVGVAQSHVALLYQQHTGKASR